MTKRMLIDASHAEETRVVMLDGNRLEDYDVETAARKQLKGNIYLAKIVRVEPSLQAAFVEYGGNRHGFLAFGEIHPDYFQIPVADRQRLIALQEEEAEADRLDEEAARDREGEDAARDRELGGGPRRRALAVSPGESRSGEAAGADEGDLQTEPAAGSVPPPDDESVADGEAQPEAGPPAGELPAPSEGVDTAGAQAAHADEADGGVLPVEVGARARLHRGRDLLHARGAGIRREHASCGEGAVEQGDQPARNDGKVAGRHPDRVSRLVMSRRAFEARLGSWPRGEAGRVFRDAQLACG